VGNFGNTPGGWSVKRIRSLLALNKKKEVCYAKREGQQVWALRKKGTKH